MCSGHCIAPVSVKALSPTQACQLIIDAGLNGSPTPFGRPAKGAFIAANGVRPFKSKRNDVREQKKVAGK